MGADTVARIAISDGLAPVEGVWRALEAAGVATAYQRFDWALAYATAVPGTYRVAVVHDAAGRPAMLLPFALARRCGALVATTLGGRHANFAGPVCVPDWEARLGRADLLLKEVAARLGADVLAFEGVPAEIDGVANPLRTGGRPSPNDAFALTLGPSPAESLARGLSGAGRKKLRAKERQLRYLGTVGFLGPVPDGEVDAVLTAFFDQKARRFGRLGIADPFTDGSVRDFVRAAARSRPGGRSPAVELYALTLDGAAVAVLGGAVSDHRFSGMFISVEDSDPALLRLSPGEILIARAIARATERGFRRFDLGVGEALYKRLLCPEVEVMSTTFVAVGARGRLWTAAASLLVAAKRRIKRSGTTMRLLTAIRRWRSDRPGVQVS